MLDIGPHSNAKSSNSVAQVMTGLNNKKMMIVAASPQTALNEFIMVPFVANYKMPLVLTKN